MRSQVAILMSDKIHCKSQWQQETKNHHVIKGINSSRRYNNGEYVYAPNIGVPVYIKQILTDLRGEIENNTIMWNFNTPLLRMNRWSVHKTNKEVLDSNHTLGQIDRWNRTESTEINSHVYTQWIFDKRAKRTHWKG